MRSSLVALRNAAAAPRRRRFSSTAPFSAQSIPLYQVDSFSSKPFHGNPAAVCLLEHDPGHQGGWPLTDKELLQIAAENNLSETAFVVPRTLGNGQDAGAHTFQHGDAFNLRWFTPTTEVDLCGHATLAAATVLIKECGNQSSALRFDTLSGELIASAQPDNTIELDFPTNIPEPLDDSEVDVVEPLVRCYVFSARVAVENVLYSARTKNWRSWSPLKQGGASTWRLFQVSGSPKS